MNTTLLRDILEVQSASGQTGRMRRFVRAYLEGIGASVVVHKRNVYAVKGKADLYPCVVAHLDTVHDIVPENRYTVHCDEGLWFAWDALAYNRKKQVGDYTGVGGDDKCGIYIALQMMTELPVCKVALFRDEEIGCVGAREADLTFFNDVSFILQGDRRGKKDFVTKANGTELQSKAFIDAATPTLTKFNFVNCRFGASTDVATLASRKVGVCVANASAGYFNPHSHDEYISETDLENTYQMFKDLFATLGGQRWEHTPPAYTTTTHTYNRRTWNPATKRMEPVTDDDAWGADYDGYGYARSKTTGSLAGTSTNTYARETSQAALRRLYPDLYADENDTDEVTLIDGMYARASLVAADKDERKFLKAQKKSPAKAGQRKPKVIVKNLDDYSEAELWALAMQAEGGTSQTWDDFQDSDNSDDVAFSNFLAMQDFANRVICPNCGTYGVTEYDEDVGVFCWTCQEVVMTEDDVLDEMYGDDSEVIEGTFSEVIEGNADRRSD